MGSRLSPFPAGATPPCHEPTDPAQGKPVAIRPGTESQAISGSSQATEHCPLCHNHPAPVPINSPSGRTALLGPLSRFRRIMSILQQRICGYKAHVFDYTAPVKGDLFHSLAGELLWLEVSQEIYASPFVAATQPRWSLEAGCSRNSPRLPGIRSPSSDSQSQTPGARAWRRQKQIPLPWAQLLASLFCPTHCSMST